MMKRWSARAAVFPGLSLLATACVAGCGGGGDNGHQVLQIDAGVPPARAREPGAGGIDFTSESARKTTDGIAHTGTTGASGEPAGPSDGGSSRTTVDTEQPRDAAAEAARRSCIPEGGIDEPDEDFVDSNCDGIDGDASAAVFVAPTGNDDAVGSMDAPLKTVTHAVAVAAAAGKSVYLCDAEYAESVELAGTAVSLYGGYDCDRGWRRELGRAAVRPPSGIPFVAKSLTAPMVVERVAFRAPAAKDVGGSSIAASVVGSTQIRFAQVLFQASTGQDGEGGAAVANQKPWSSRWAPAADAIPLTDADHCYAHFPGSPDWYGDPNCNQTSTGATGRTRVCPDGSKVRGGAGGDGGSFFLEPDPTAAAFPAGKAGSSGLPTSSGRDGESGSAGKPGARGSNFGEIADGLYVANNDGDDGGYGGRGGSGNGGDGGAGITGSTEPVIGYAPGGGGGQGGYGGCGGVGGKGGRGGGASIALIVVDSGVSIESSTLETGSGGKGGSGGDGASGQPGGRGGSGAEGSGSAFPGVDGGQGGDGGPGGSGGPGGGGPSIGIVYVGDAPATTNLIFELGIPGHGGTSGGFTGAAGVGAEIHSPR